MGSGWKTHQKVLGLCTGHHRCGGPESSQPHQSHAVAGAFVPWTANPYRLYLSCIRPTTTFSSFPADKTSAAILSYHFVAVPAFRHAVPTHPDCRSVKNKSTRPNL